MNSIDSESPVVQEVARSRERGVGAALPRQPALCLKRQEAYIRLQEIQHTAMLNFDTIVLMDGAPMLHGKGVSRALPPFSCLRRPGAWVPRYSYWVHSPVTGEGYPSS
jgi:hypothetical protein